MSTLVPSAGTRRWRPWPVALLAGVLLASALPAQDIVRSAVPWRTLQTRWFTVHYPLDAERWALDLAPQLDAVHDSVEMLVGYAPPGRTTILIDDPYNQANGKAIPILGAPLIHLWVTPPSPTDQIANHRGWGVKLVAHEFGHIAHLSRPVRGRTQWYWHALPASLSAITASSPTWAIEGYATWIEGKVTGSGRPHGVWRPALLRELALAGRLPSYGALNGGGYKGGSIPYLAGSAFWEWLAAQRGDTSMTLVFRRQTARTRRSFDEAFRGVYGDSPATLYGRFAAELTAKAFAVDSALRPGGIVAGTRLARFQGVVGGPAVTRDGQRMALRVNGTGGRPGRVIVLRTDTLVTTPRERDALAKALARDPLDVPSIRTIPRLAPALATLPPRRGRSFVNPRFIDAAGQRVLLETWSVQRDGTQRPDLATWDTKSGDVRLVTDGAAVQDGDPSPDGNTAAAIRCVTGSCSLVLVSMATGAVTPLADGAPRVVYAHPRWSPDGQHIAVSVQREDGTWRLALVRVADGTQRVVSPADDVNRHSAGFDAAGTSLLYVSEAGGIPNVESLRLADGSTTPRTRVDASVYEPVAMPDGGVLFLQEYAGGMDLQRLHAGVVVPPADLGDVARLLSPALPRAREAGMALSRDSVAPPRPYVTGPRHVRFMAQVTGGIEGLTGGVTMASVDPANRLAWTLSALAGTPDTWRGGVASTAWYGRRPVLRGEVFWLQQDATRQPRADRLQAGDLRLAGGSVSAELPLSGSSLSQRLLVSVFAGAARGDTVASVSRTQVAASYAVAGVLGWRVSAGASLRGAVGQLDDDRFARGSAGVYLSARGVRLDARAHRASLATPPAEQFSAGGFAAPVADELTLSQRVAAPAFPVGIARGRSLYETRLSMPAPLLGIGTLYAHAVGTDTRPDRQSVAVGVEQGVAFDHLGIATLPRLRALTGVAYIARGPSARHGMAYVTLAWRP